MSPPLSPFPLLSNPLSYPGDSLTRDTPVSSRGCPRASPDAPAWPSRPLDPGWGAGAVEGGRRLASPGPSPSGQLGGSASSGSLPPPSLLRRGGFPPHRLEAQPRGFRLPLKHSPPASRPLPQGQELFPACDLSLSLSPRSLPPVRPPPAHRDPPHAALSLRHSSSPSTQLATWNSGLDCRPRPA